MHVRYAVGKNEENFYRRRVLYTCELTMYRKKKTSDVSHTPIQFSDNN